MTHSRLEPGISIVGMLPRFTYCGYTNLRKSWKVEVWMECKVSENLLQQRWFQMIHAFSSFSSMYASGTRIRFRLFLEAFMPGERDCDCESRRGGNVGVSAVPPSNFSKDACLSFSFLTLSSSLSSSSSSLRVKMSVSSMSFLSPRAASSVDIC